MDLLFKTPREIALEHEVNQLRRTLGEVTMGDRDAENGVFRRAPFAGTTASPEEVRLKAENDRLKKQISLMGLRPAHHHTVWFDPDIRELAETSVTMRLAIEAGWEKDFGGYHIYGRERRPDGLRLGYYLSNNAMLQSHDRTTILAHTMRTACEQLAKEKPE